MNYIGRASTTFHHHPAPVSFRRKGEELISLLQICESVAPPCNLNPFLFNGHLQTFWTAIKGQDIPVYYKRYLFTADDISYPGAFAVDFAVSPYHGTDPNLPPRTTFMSKDEYDALGSVDNKPMLVALHGLSGGSHELYLRAVLEPLIAAGFECLVVNSRGCAMSQLTSGVLYNARATWDVRQVVKCCRDKWPKRKLFGIGFSLGANILLNYLGEEGERCMLHAAVICSNPYNLEIGSVALQSTWLGLEVYSKTMGTSMKKLFEDHVEQISKNPRINVDRVRNIKYLHEFDRELQGPTWGYPTEGAYYRDASSTDSLLAVKIPLFAIHAKDDPIAVDKAVPYEEFKKTPYAVLCTTSLGGHLSWFEIGGTRWFSKPASQFLIKMADEIDLVRPAEIPPGHDEMGLATTPTSPTFSPMRRKLQMHIEP